MTTGYRLLLVPPLHFFGEAFLELLHELLDDSGAAIPFQIGIGDPGDCSLLDRRGQRARPGKAEAASRAMHPVRLAAQALDGVARAGIGSDLRREAAKDIDGVPAFGAKTDAQRTEHGFGFRQWSRPGHRWLRR